MIQRKSDYIQKVIEQLTFFLGKVLGLVDDGKFEEAEAMIDEKVDEVTSLKKDALEESSMEDFHKHIKELSLLQVGALADLLLHDIRLKEKAGKELNNEWLSKGVFLFEYLEKEEKTFSFDRQQKIQEIKSRMM